MAAEDLSLRVLTYLKQKGPVNTFRLARELGIPRDDVLTLLGDLEKKGAAGSIGAGRVQFLKFPEEKKVSVKKEKARRVTPEAAKKEVEVSHELHEIKGWVKERLSLFDGMVEDVVRLEEVTKGLVKGQSGATNQFHLMGKRLDAVEESLRDLKQKTDKSSEATEALIKEYIAKVEKVLSREPLAAVKKYMGALRKTSQDNLAAIMKKSRESLAAIKEKSQGSLTKAEKISKDSVAAVKRTLSAVRSRPGVKKEPKAGKKKRRKAKRR